MVSMIAFAAMQTLASGVACIASSCQPLAGPAAAQLFMTPAHGPSLAYTTTDWPVDHIPDSRSDVPPGHAQACASESTCRRGKLSDWAVCTLQLMQPVSWTTIAGPEHLRGLCRKQRDEALQAAGVQDGDAEHAGQNGLHTHPEQSSAAEEQDGHTEGTR